MLDEKLKMMISEHQKWMETRISGSCGNWCNSSVSDVDFSIFGSLHHFNFSSSVFSFVHSSGNDFRFTYFSQCVLKDCVFYDVDFEGVDFSYCMMERVSFLDCNMPNCVFTGSSLYNVNFGKSNLYRSNFSQTEAENCSFSECVLKRITCANFAGCNNENFNIKEHQYEF